MRKTNFGRSGRSNVYIEVRFRESIEVLYMTSNKLVGCIIQIYCLLLHFSDILPMLAFVEQKTIKQTTVFRGPLQIGSNIKLNVYGYIRVSINEVDFY